MPDRSRRGGAPALGKALGVFSLALGAAQLSAPDGLGRLAGLRDGRPVRLANTLVGMRELVQGTGILAGSRPDLFLWSRVLGDVADVSLLAVAARRRGVDGTRSAIGLAALAGVTVLDLVAALQAEGGDGDTAIAATAAVTVNRPPDEVYRHWRDLEQLPTFMAHLRSVQALSSTRSRWEAVGPAGTTVRWVAEITEDRPGERIAWRSTDEADVDNVGSVVFRRAPGDRGTEVRVDLRYTPPGGRAGRAAALLLGEAPDQQVRDDLRRFKQVVELGEIVRSEGSPTGQSTRQQVAQRPARPVR